MQACCSLPSSLWLHLTFAGTGAKGHTLVPDHAQMREINPRAALPCSNTWQTLRIAQWCCSPAQQHHQGSGGFVSQHPQHPAMLLLVVVLGM